MTSNDVKIVESLGRKNGKVQYSTRKDKTRHNLDTTQNTPHSPSSSDIFILGLHGIA